jgi:ATP-dependent helicase YprA (DUF1998 family)
LHYANKFLGVENLHGKREPIEDYNLHVTQIRRMIIAIAAETDKSLSTEDIDKLIHENLWDNTEGAAVAMGNDDDDLHIVSTPQLNLLINSVKKL